MKLKIYTKRGFFMSILFFVISVYGILSLINTFRWILFGVTLVALFIGIYETYLLISKKESISIIDVIKYEVMEEKQ